jgi:hypothetical protein
MVRLAPFVKMFCKESILRAEDESLLQVCITDRCIGRVNTIQEPLMREVVLTRFVFWV